MPVNSSSVGHEVVRNGNLDFVSPICFQSLLIVRLILQNLSHYLLTGPGYCPFTTDICFQYPSGARDMLLISKLYYTHQLS